MRPDTRSFSFTWLRGTQHQEELSLGRPTTRSQTVSRGQRSAYENMVTDEASPEGQRNAAAQQKCSTGKRKLRRLGSSFLQNVTSNAARGGGAPKYDFIEEEVEVNEGQGQGERNFENETPARPTMSIGKRLNKTVQEVKTTLENMSQRFRRSSMRRYRMKAESPQTPASPTRRILGRTPTKLYSPFDFDTPSQKTPKRLGTGRGSTPRLSGSKSEMDDVKDLRKGLHKFKLMTRGVTRRSVRF